MTAVNQYAVRHTAIQVDTELSLPSGSQVNVAGTVMTLTELLTPAGVTPGAASASKAVILDSAKGVTGLGITALALTDATAAAGTTTRLLKAEYTLSYAGTTTFTGSQVGVRGAVTVSAGTTLGASGYVYGAQGKVTIAGSAGGNVYGVIGQFDFSAATALASGILAPVWADWGASSTALSGSAYGSLIRAQNTTSAVLSSHVYLYGKASVVFDITSNTSDCVVAGAGTYSTADGYLAVTINGSAMRIPYFAGTD